MQTELSHVAVSCAEIALSVKEEILKLFNVTFQAYFWISPLKKYRIIYLHYNIFMVSFF